MPKLEPSPELTFPPTLADLSRNASVISTSSSDSGSPHIVTTPKARPLRTFTSPRSRSPRSPSGVRASSKPPAYLNKEFGLMDDPAEVEAATARARSGSRKPQGLPSVRDFAFAATLGEGSYSEVSLRRETVQTYLPCHRSNGQHICEQARNLLSKYWIKHSSNARGRCLPLWTRRTPWLGSVLVTLAS